MSDRKNNQSNHASTTYAIFSRRWKFKTLTIALLGNKIEFQISRSRHVQHDTPLSDAWIIRRRARRFSSRLLWDSVAYSRLRKAGRSRRCDVPLRISYTAYYGYGQMLYGDVVERTRSRSWQIVLFFVKKFSLRLWCLLFWYIRVFLNIDLLK